MPDLPTRTLLREAVTRLAAIVPNPFANHALARKIAAMLAATEMPRDANLVVQAARRNWREVRGVAIDADEMGTRPHPDGVEVRGWLLVRHADLPADDPDSVARAVQLLEGMAPRTREIFTLSQCHGYEYAEIAANLGISQRCVRRHMLRAISHIARAR